MSIRNSIAALVALFVLSGVACSSGDSELGAMTVRPLAGVVEIHRGNEVISVTDDEALEPQDVVVTGKRGLAQLELEDENTITMVDDSEMRIRSTSTVEGQKGTLIAEGSSMKVLFDGVESHLADAVFRLDQSFGSARAASYSGTVHLSAPGETGLVLDTLYEVDVAAGDLPDRRSPYDLDLGDALDNEYLTEVIELNDELDRVLTGFSRQLRRSRPGLDYFAGLAGTSRLGFMKSYLSRAPTDLLVGFLIAANDPKLSLRGSFVRAFGLRDDGARWAVAATIMNVETNPLLAQLDRLILGASVADGTGGSGDITFASTDGGPASGGTDPGGSDDDSGGTISGGTGGTGDADGNGGDGGDSDDCTGSVDCAVKDLEDELPPGPGPDPEPEPRDVDLLDDTTGKL